MRAMRPPCWRSWRSPPSWSRSAWPAQPGWRRRSDDPELVAEVEGSGAPVYVAEPAVAESMTGFHLHRGALAAMQRSGAHLGHVRNAQGRFAGVLFLEDILELLVGEVGRRAVPGGCGCGRSRRHRCGDGGSRR